MAVTAPKPTVPPSGRRRLILRRHARIQNNRPAVCGQHRAKTKVIYDTPESAQAAADELHALDGKTLYPYPCPRSKHGHHHHSSTRPSETDQPDPGRTDHP